MTREQFLTSIECTKESMDYDFDSSNAERFIIIDKDTLHCKTYTSLPDKILGQWIIVVSLYTYQNWGYTNPGIVLIGMYDLNFRRVDYIPFGFWLLKDIDFVTNSSLWFSCSNPIPVLEHRFDKSLKADKEWDKFMGIMNFEGVLKEIWDFEIANRSLEFKLDY
jgi:hypothetical protein